MSAPFVGYLCDGPLAGTFVDIFEGDRRLSALRIHVDRLVLDEDREEVHWIAERYERVPLHVTRYDPTQPWGYFWNPED